MLGLQAVQFLGAVVEETVVLFFVVDVPVVQVHLGVQLWTKLLTCPSLCNDRVFHSGGATDTYSSSPVYVDIQLCNTDGYDVSSNFAYGSDDGFFDAFCVIFRAPPAMPELSASFSSLRALTPVSARGLPGVLESPGVYSQVTWHRDAN